MEIHSRCRYDFVAAFNGNSTHTPDEIGRYCGNQTRVPPVLKSQFNTMTVQFKTDRSVTARGSVYLEFISQWAKIRKKVAFSFGYTASNYLVGCVIQRRIRLVGVIFFNSENTLQEKRM